MDGTTDYSINFFKPRTPFLKENVRIIIIGLTIWAVCVFGFHILMKIVEKKTPEPGYVTYEAVYPKLADGTAAEQEKIDIAKVYLGLVGKSIALQKNESLKEAFTATVYDVLPQGEKEPFKAAAAQAVTDKSIDTSNIVRVLGLEENQVLKGAIPYALAPLSENAAMTAAEIPAIMDTYLIHYQSFLTDSKLFGFPFHYFYSAVFLLILFNLICLVYCYIIDGVMKKYGMESDEE